MAVQRIKPTFFQRRRSFNPLLPTPTGLRSVVLFVPTITPRLFLHFNSIRLLFVTLATFLPALHYVIRQHRSHLHTKHPVSLKRGALTFSH